MTDNRQHHNDPWDDGAYGTGRIKPPKRHGGRFAFLLVLLIFMVGLASGMGVLNVQLFSQLKQTPKNQRDLVGLISETQAPPASADPSAPEPTAAANAGNETCLTLNKSPDSVQTVIQEGGLSLQEIYDKSIHSVVSISSTLADGVSSGTGVIFSADGFIVTNAHVVQDALTISVCLTDERRFNAIVVGADAVSDLAVLQIPASELTAAEFGDSSVLRVGDGVVAIGDPLGSQFRGTMTNGIVSAINRDVVTNGRTMTLIQTNAALNPGNSGGPLINCYGQVIGINTLKIGNFTDNTAVEGIGFAIPSTTVKEVIDQLISQGYVSGRPSLGITGERIPTFYQRYYRMPAGLFITHLKEDSPAKKIGMKEGDILVRVAGTQVTNMDELNQLLFHMQIGDTVQVVIFRSGVQYTIELPLTEATN